MKNWITPATAILIAGIAFAAGRWTSDNTNSSKADHANSTPSAESSLSKLPLGSANKSTGTDPELLPPTSHSALDKTDNPLTIPSTFDEPDRVKRKQQYYSLLADMTLEKVDTLIEHFANISDWTERHQSEYSEFLYTWAKLDGSSAMEFVMADDSQRTKYARTSAISGWTLSNPEAAKAFVASQEAGDRKDWLHYGIVLGLVDSDIDAAIDYAPTNGPSRARAEAVERIAERLFEKRGVDGVLNWIDGISATGPHEAGSYRDVALREALVRIAEIEPELAIQKLAAEGNPDYIKISTYYGVAREAADGDEAIALEILGNLPNGKARDGALFGMLRNLSNRRPNDAAKWIDTHTTGEMRDRAIDTFSNAIYRKEPETALSWAITIKDEARRRKIINQLANDWLRKKPEEAKAWLDAHPDSGFQSNNSSEPPRRFGFGTGYRFR